MTLLNAIQKYVEARQAHGVLFYRGADDLRYFASRVGDVPLNAIRTTQVLDFLSGPRTSAATWRKKFSFMKSFFEHWADRGMLDALPMPVNRPPVPLTFVPYVYTRDEVRLLLRATSLWENSSWQVKKCARMDSATFRMLLLTLYATGMRTGEALSLTHEDVDLKKGVIHIRGGRYYRSRSLPIGPDLCARLRRHKRGLTKRPSKSAYVFVGKDGKALHGTALRVAFRTLRRLAGIQRHDGTSCQPRMDDLRTTFAVHRLTAWLRQGADLNRLIPALSAYLGQCGLVSSERYLKLTPERFRTQLNKLSPQHPKRKRWRDDPTLMKFLAGL